MAQRTQDKKFNFFIPLTIEKSKDGEGKELVKISGVASSAVPDSDGETLEPAGFDFKPLLQAGFLNWNHQGQKTSKAICGEPTAAKIINKGKDFYIEGFLYPNEEGKYVAELAETLEKHSPNRRLGFSIEGQPIAVDPFNKKRITKARVTGVAITQCPKNPNTLLSIMKGEYADAFQDPIVEDEEETEEEKKTKKKAMTTESIAPATPEHVEGGEKIKDQVDSDKGKKVGSYLKKSEIYGIIKSRYDVDSTLAQEIYSFVEQLNQNIYNMEKSTVSKETLTKAFEILELAKGKKEGAISTKKEGEDNDLDVEVDDKDAAALKKSEEEGSSEEDEEAKKIKKAEMDDKIQKAKEIAGVFHKAGMSKDDCTKAMEKSGYDIEVSEGAYDACVSDANANTDGGKLQGMSLVETGIVKSMITEAITAATAPLLKEIKALHESNNRKFTAMATIMKSSEEENTLLKSQLDGAITSMNGVNEKLEQFGSQRQPRKSLQQAQNKFPEGSGENGIQKSDNSIPLGCEAYNIDNKADLRKLAQTLSSKVEIMKSQSGDTSLVRRLEDTITEIEVGYFVDPAMYPTLRNMNIILQKGQAA